MNVLVIQNDPIVPVGQLSAFLGGHEVVRAWEDPQRLQDLAAAPLSGALILLGGRANAYDDEAWPWLEAERKLLRRCVLANIRVLGICLGAQLIAATFGGRVSVSDPAGPEYGVIPRRPRRRHRGTPPRRARVGALGQVHADLLLRHRPGRPIPPRGHARDRDRVGRE